MSKRPAPRDWLSPVAAGLSLGAIFVAVVGIPLDAAAALELSADLTSSWILVVYGLPSVLTIGMTLRYRQPLAVTGNIFILIFVLLLGGELSWSELVGATMAAGAVVVVLAALGLTDRVAELLPGPIVHALLAGAVLGLVADAVTALGPAPLLVGATFVAYLLSRAAGVDRLPPILVALAAGVLVAVLGSDTGSLPTPEWPTAAITPPEFSLRGLLTATPVMVVFITVQANAPSIVLLRDNGFDPPERVISMMSGVGTAAGSLFGPMGVSLSLPATALVAGPGAGERRVRTRAAHLAAGVGVGVALSAGFAGGVIDFIPDALLEAIVGLAVLEILLRSLREAVTGPLAFGPLVTFAVAVSDLELLGLGGLFWGLVFGLGVSLLLERKAWATASGRG